MAALAEEYNVERALSSYREDFTISPATRASRIADARRSMSTVIKKTSSKNTIFNIANTMVGSCMIVFPNIFYESGLITTLIVMTFVGLVSCKTAVCQVIHFNQETETDFAEVVDRVLGRKWKNAYIFFSVLLLWVCGVIYYLLICNLFFLFLQYIVNQAGGKTQNMNETRIEWEAFSFQYAALFLIVICYFMVSIKNLDKIKRLGQYGVYLVAIFIIYVIIMGIYNIANNEKVTFTWVYTSNVRSFTDLIMITPKIGKLTGVFALSFFIHNLLLALMKKNANPRNNERDLSLGYLLTALIYAFVGVFGALAVVGLKPSSDSPSTLFDYLQPAWHTCVIELLLFCQLMTVLPILWYICRTQLGSLLEDFIYLKNIDTNTQPNSTNTITASTLITMQRRRVHLYTMGSNILFAFSCIIVGIFNPDPTLVMTIAGALCGFMLIYFFPIIVHLKCLYGRAKSEALIQQNYVEDGVLVDHLDIRRIDENDDEDELPCGRNHNNLREKIEKKYRYVFYTFLMLVGLAIVIIKLVNLKYDNF